MCLSQRSLSHPVEPLFIPWEPGLRLVMGKWAANDHFPYKMTSKWAIRWLGWAATCYAPLKTNIGIPKSHPWRGKYRNGSFKILGVYKSHMTLVFIFWECKIVALFIHQTKMVQPLEVSGYYTWFMFAPFRMLWIRSQWNARTSIQKSVLSIMYRKNHWSKMRSNLSRIDGLVNVNIYRYTKFMDIITL